MLLLLTSRYLALRNRLTRLAPGDGLKTTVLGLFGLGFWAFMYGISFKVLSYFRTIEGLGDLLALRLMSMVLLTFCSILVFRNVVTSLSTFYLSDRSGAMPKFVKRCPKIVPPREIIRQNLL